MSYCEVCKKHYKEGYATSQRHLDSKAHKENLKRSGKTKRLEEGIRIDTIHELILYNIVQNQNGVKYSEILRFFSSFGVKSEITLRTLIKKLKDGDIVYKGNIDSDYELILNKILEIPRMNYPLTISIQEAYDKFRFLNLKYPSDLMDYFATMANKYPGFLGLSSSRIGEPSDLITFKQIFIDKLKFYKINNWDI